MPRLLNVLAAVAISTLVAWLVMLALPSSLLATRVLAWPLFALLFALTARLLQKTLVRAPASPLRLAFVSGTALPILFVVNLAAFVHLEIATWSDPRSSVYCAGIGSTLAPCRTPESQSALPPPSSTPTKTVSIVMHGWHTGLILDTRDIDVNVWPEGAEFKSSAFIEVGWGDAGFFPAEAPTIALALDAMLTPGPSVAHVATLRRPPEERFADKEVIKLALSDDGYADMLKFVADTFVVKPYGGFRFVFPGDYRDGSRFVAANGLYHFGNTCNVWMANALERGGIPLTPRFAISSRALMAQLRPFAVRVSQ